MTRVLVLSSSRSSWQVSAGHCSDSDKSFPQDLRKELLARDRNTCAFCGWQSAKGQEIHHLNDDHADLSRENLVVSCPLCHQCHHLGTAGISDGGRMIWMPEITQVELNHLCRILFVAMSSKDESYASSAKTLFGSLESRTTLLEQQMTSGASDPSFWAQAFVMMDREAYLSRAERLSGIRLLPSYRRFAPLGKIWGDTISVNLPMESWERFADLKGLKDDTA